MSNIFKKLKSNYKKAQPEEMTLEEYVGGLKDNPEYYATAPERMLKAIGKPKLVDTAKDDRLSRIHGNRIIKKYEAFHDFYGMEAVIERIVNFFKYAAQGLEEDKQVLYLLGPVGSAKSSLSERIKLLIAKEPIYILKGSPVNESPLGLFGPEMAEELGIPDRYLRYRLSPWAVKRLDEFKGDISKFKVVKIYPNESKQAAISVVHAGDPNTQDISTLVGKVDIRKLESLSQNDPDAYSYSGGLCRGNQGVMEFVEMFKADIKMLNPMLTATQEGTFNGTESIGSMPFEGIILAHSNETEWDSFATDKSNEALLSRISVIKVPYCLQVEEEIEIYGKYLRSGQLAKAPCAPGTLRMLAEFAVLTRLNPVEGAGENPEIKLRVYNGENIKDKFPNAKSLQEYKELLTGPEGFDGMETREAFKVLSKVFNYDMEEVAANPVHMLVTLKEEINNANVGEDDKVFALDIVDELLTGNFLRTLRKDIQTAFLDSYEDFGQNLFDKYIVLAEYWIDDRDFRDPDTGQLLDKASLNEYLEKVEKPARIGNPKDFRAEVVRFALKYQASHDGKNPSWQSWAKVREVLEKNMFSNTEELLPIIAFTGKGDKAHQSKHREFVDRMNKKGYTNRQVRLLVDWFIKQDKSS